MTAVLGALLGVVAGTGALLAGSALAERRRSSLALRLEPYLGSAPTLGASVPWAGRLARLLGGEDDLARHLRAAGRDDSVVIFRARQAVAWAATAGGVGLVLFGLRLAGGRVTVVGSGLGMVAFGAIAPVALQLDVRLAAARRRLAIELEMPALAGLLSLCLSAGESLRSAIARSASVSGGILGPELRRVVNDVEGGMPLGDALRSLSSRADVPALTRMLDSLELARERGVPVAGALRAQAGDLRGAATRRLVEVAGRRQVWMLVPVVFLILPVCVLFAFWPALQSLHLLTT